MAFGIPVPPGKSLFAAFAGMFALGLVLAAPSWSGVARFEPGDRTGSNAELFSDRSAPLIECRRTPSPATASTTEVMARRHPRWRCADAQHLPASTAGHGGLMQLEEL